MKIRVLTSCTAAKAASSRRALQRSDFARGRDAISRWHDEAADDLVPAEHLYRGQHHIRLMAGVRYARAAGVEVELSVVSAGYGLVRGEARLANYECSFDGMPAHERRAWARHLGIPRDVASLLGLPADLTMILLGEAYLDACGLAPNLRVGAPTVVFCGAAAALRLPPLDGLTVVRLAVEHTRAFHCGLVGLKGEVGARALRFVAGGGEPNAISATCFLNVLETRGPVNTETVPAEGALF